MKLRCDNQVAIFVASYLVSHERTKHIEVDCHFLCENIQEGLLVTGHVQTDEQLAVTFTKALNRNRIDYIGNKLSIINIYAPA